MNEHKEDQKMNESNIDQDLINRDVEDNTMDEVQSQESVSGLYSHAVFQEERDLIKRIKAECSKLLIAQDDVIEKMLICIIADGHILLEGVPGIAKTLSARVLSRSIDSEFSRIQFTPDLMPSDVLGTSIFDMKKSVFQFKKGPIFSNVVLIDEINRAPAKTQSALFEAMEEKQISFDGETYQLGYPFVVIATQNPIEQEGTYRLPEAQLDRFMMKIVLDYPSFDNEMEILQKFKTQVGKLDLSVIKPILNEKNLKNLQIKASNIVVEDQMLNYITSIVQETRNNSKIYLGASPRASLAILKTSKVVAMISGRDYIIPDDVQYVARDIINHRIILSPDAEMSGITNYSVIDEIIELIEVPR